MALLKRSFSIRLVLFFTISFLILVPKSSFAQSIYEQVGRLPITTYTTEEYGGIPGVYTSIQNENGLMYFGAIGNMYEYDGVSWRPLFKKNALVTIQCFAKDSSGRIFYGGQDFGYLQTDPKGETRAISLLHLIPEQYRSSFQATAIHFWKDKVILKTANIILQLELEVDFTLKSLKSWQPDTRFGKSFLVANQIYVRQVDRGLFLLDEGDLKLIPGTENIFGKETVSIMLSFPEKSNEAILIGGINTGFYFYENGMITKFPTEVDLLIKKGNLIYDAIPHQGNYILGFFGGGIAIINPKGEILKMMGTDQGLPSDVVTSVYLDQNQGLWVTTEDGMARISINSPLLSFDKDLGINSAVLSIKKMGDELFLGTNTGLLKFDKIDKQFKPVLPFDNSQVFSLEFDEEDLIVTGRQLQVFRKGKAIRLDGPGNTLSTLIPKNNPNILLAGSLSGLLIYQKGLSKEYPWEFMGKVPEVGNLGSIPILEAKDGTIFSIGVGKIYVINPKEIGLETGDPTRIKVNTFDAKLSDTFSMVNGEFYKTSQEGMQKYSTKDGKFVPTDDFRAIEKEVLDFNQDKAGITWYESFDKKKYILKRNKEGKFVKDERPNSIAPYLSQVDFIDEDSILWFGSPKGLIRYDPKKDNQTDKEFFTLIRRIETKTDTIPLPFYGRNKGLAPVERKDNSYRFEFAAPYFEEEKKTKYQTYLEGFDPDWVDWNDNKFKEYTNLPAGTYTFRVRAMAFTGRISEEAVYSFVVLAPWYATWWAYLIYAFLIGIAITAIVKWRSRQLKIENRILEDRVAERTAALEKSIAELKSTQAQLIQSEKMASLGELTAGIAHEIQNPLNFVNNFSELSVELIDEMGEEIEKGDLEEVKAIASDLKDNLKKINHHGKRAGSIVKGMLAHSRKSSTEKEITDINALADECLRLSFHGLRAKDKSFTADFKTDLDPTIPKINVVSQDIGRVILNLINNAFYAVREKAKSASSDFKPEVIVQTRKVDNSLIVKIQDNGQGIPESIKEKILQPFFTTKPAGEGTGLGLSLSYDIIKAHGGELKIESQEGEGTTFSIVLPAQN